MYGCIPPLAVRDAARVQKRLELLGSGLDILSSQGCPSTETRGGGVQQIVYKPCRFPAFCRCINIPPPTSRINNGNGHGYRRRYGFYRFVSPDHRREFLEWFNRSYDARLEPLIRSSERG